MLLRAGEDEFDLPEDLGEIIYVTLRAGFNDYALSRIGMKEMLDQKDRDRRNPLRAFPRYFACVSSPIYRIVVYPTPAENCDIRIRYYPAAKEI